MANLANVLGLGALIAAYGCSAGTAAPAARVDANGGTQALGGSGGASVATPPGSGGSLLVDLQPDAGNASGSTGTVLDPSAACAKETRNSEPLVSDLFIMVDRSVSMTCDASDTACTSGKSGKMPPSRWQAVSSAVNGFVTAPTSAGIGAGIGFFPLPDVPVVGSQPMIYNHDCDPAHYALPTVKIGPLSASASALSGALSATSPGGNTPSNVALQGAIDYAKSYTLATPGRTAAVVLVTDGLPLTCNATVQNTADAAQAAFMGSPPIKTFVIGLGNVAALDAIALAGSGGLVHYFPAQGADVTGTLTAALTDIGKKSIGCDYAIPTNGNDLDYGAVNVQVTVGSTGAPTFVGKVDGAAQCGALGGWYYDVNPPGIPAKLTLCPDSCSVISAAAGSQLQVLIGCASQPPK